MRIEVTKEIDAETQDVYGFNIFDWSVVFTTYHRQVKPKGKRKWYIIGFWDQYARNSTFNEPSLPEDIKYHALQKVYEHVKILTWAEWKSKT